MTIHCFYDQNTALLQIIPRACSRSLGRAGGRFRPGGGSRNRQLDGCEIGNWTEVLNPGQRRHRAFGGGAGGETVFPGHSV